MRGENQSIKTDPEPTQVLELADIDIKTVYSISSKS